MNYQTAPDLDLWNCCRQDDLRAYRELFRRFSPKLYKQAVGYLKDGMIAEELVMDLLLTIWQKRHDGIMQNDVGAYLFRAMRNEVLKHLRRNIPATLPLESIQEDRFKEQRSADHKLIEEDYQQLYEAKLSQLSPQRRQVFRLSREQHLSYAEIAAELNISVNTVENYMVAALKTLRSNQKGELLAGFYLFLCTIS